MRYVKYHGAGNDYIVLDGRNGGVDWSALARLLCHRNTGVGSDGIALIVPSTIADIGMHIFNPDGSQAEMSGNGIRCFMKYVIEHKVVIPKNQRVQVETLAGVKTVYPSMIGVKVVTARVNMGQPHFRPEEIPLAMDGLSLTDSDMNRSVITECPVRIGEDTLHLTFVSMGNPHAVLFTKESVETFPLSIIGPRVETHPVFPQRVNFEVANIVDRDNLKARFWERGAAETLASGTGSSAVAVAAHLLAMTNHDVDISVPGGTLKVSWDGQGEVWLEGPVEEVCEGIWKGAIPTK